MTTYLAIPGGYTDGVAYGDQTGSLLVGFSNFYQMFEKLILMVRIDPIERGLILEIIRNHSDPNLRMVYGDWLEENARDLEAMAEREAAKILAERHKSLTEHCLRSNSSRCTYRGYCPIHENPCNAKEPGALASCWDCGKSIFRQDEIRSLGSQGIMEHPEWALIFCSKCRA